MVVAAVVVVQGSGVANGGSRRRTNSSTGKVELLVRSGGVLGLSLVAGRLCVVVAVVLGLVVIVWLRRIV